LKTDIFRYTLHFLFFYSIAMRVSLSLLVALVGTTFVTARDVPASTTKTRRTRTKAPANAQQGSLTFTDEEEKGFLSIPQDDPDPAGRVRRLSYRAPFWDFKS
jgi:cytochrome oxidase Cu insertion factor (SCO1/SenC/PrrC family)